MPASVGGSVPRMPEQEQCDDGNNQVADTAQLLPLEGRQGIPGIENAYGGYDDRNKQREPRYPEESQGQHQIDTAGKCQAEDRGPQLKHPEQRDLSGP